MIVWSYWRSKSPSSAASNYASVRCCAFPERAAGVASALLACYTMRPSAMQVGPAGQRREPAAPTGPPRAAGQTTGVGGQNSGHIFRRVHSNLVLVP